MDNGITPIALPSDNWVPQIWMTSGFSRALGSDEACEEATNKILTNQAVFNDYPEFAMVIDDYLKMFDKGYFNSDYLTVDYDTVLDRLVTGETAMLYGATSILNTIQSSYPDANLEMFNPPVSYDQKDLLSTCLLYTSGGAYIALIDILPNGGGHIFFIELHQRIRHLTVQVKLLLAHIAFERRELLLVEGDGQVHLLHWHFLSQS